jgi:hypothetical protein
MSHSTTSRRRPLRRSRQRGVLLGIVLVLLAILFAAGVFALWSLRGDTASAGRDRMSRQLFDCAEQGLAWGKQYFSTAGQTSGTLNGYLAANVCSTQIGTSPTRGPLPCWTNGGPFPTGGTGNVTGYPNQSPYTQQITMNPNSTSPDFEYTVGIYNDPAEASPYTNTKGRVIVYSRCSDLQTGQSRAVQALIAVTASSSTDYTGQAGRGFRNQGNQNF